MGGVKRGRGHSLASVTGTRRQFPRTARLNQVLREVVADELEELAASDLRLDLLTVTAVECDPDLRHATVLLASMSDEARRGLAEARTRLQSAVAHQVRLKRTPQLSFEVDRAIVQGARVEEIIRAIHASDGAQGDEARAPGEGA